MKAGRKFGLILFVVGCIIGAINLVLLFAMEMYFPKYTAAVPVLLLLGLAMIIFPGKAEGKEALEQLSILWEGTSMVDRAAWIISSIIGFAIGFYIIFGVL